MNFGERNPGCVALLQDNGRDKVHIPICMGGALVAGALVELVGCNNAPVCRPLLPDGPNEVSIVFKDDDGRVTGITVATKDTAATPTPSSYRGA